MPIRSICPEDHEAVWSILEPTIRAGETYTLPRGMPRADALAYWIAQDRETWVFEDEAGRIVGTYFLRANQEGGGAHVANCAYMTAGEATGRGIARQMCEHSMVRAKERGFRAMQFNFVVASNEAAVHLWRKMGFRTVGRLPGAFVHPRLGDTDALVMFREL